MEELSCTELSHILLENGISETVVNNFTAHELNGKCCLQLTETEIKEIAPKIADRVKLREFITNYKQGGSIAIKSSNKDLEPRTSLSSVDDSEIDTFYIETASPPGDQSASEFAATPTLSNVSRQPRRLQDYLEASNSGASTVLSSQQVNPSGRSLLRTMGSSASTNAASGAGPSESPSSRFTLPHTASGAGPSESPSSRFTLLHTENWHLDFEIPEKQKFGYSASQAIDNGQVTSNAKRKIISLLRSLMVQHTLYPSSEQYISVCTKLVKKYPKLQDPVGNRIGSWKISLRNSFKNYRRDHDTSASKNNIEDLPPSKRAHLEENEELDEDEYEEIVAKMKTMQVRATNRSTCANLMAQTRGRRRQWILCEKPSVAYVLEMFPLLKDPVIFQSEYWALTKRKQSEALDAWRHWKSSIVKVAKLEVKRNSIKKLLEKYEAETCEEDYKDYIAMEILLKLLYPRNTKGVLYKQVITNDVELDLDSTTQLEPLGLIVGEVGSSDAQFLLYVERKLVLESKGFKEIIFDIFGTYFNFEIRYPKSLGSILLFFHYYIFEIEQPKKLPEPLLNFIRLSQ